MVPRQEWYHIPQTDIKVVLAVVKVVKASIFGEDGIGAH